MGELGGGCNDTVIHGRVGLLWEGVECGGMVLGKYFERFWVGIL